MNDPESEQKARELIVLTRTLVTHSRGHRRFWMGLRSRRYENKVLKAASELEKSLDKKDTLSGAKALKVLWLAYLALLAHVGIAASLYGVEIRNFLEGLVGTISDSPDYLAIALAVKRGVFNRKPSPDLLDDATRVRQLFSQLGFELDTEEDPQKQMRSWDRNETRDFP